MPRDSWIFTFLQIGVIHMHSVIAHEYQATGMSKNLVSMTSRP